MWRTRCTSAGTCPLCCTFFAFPPGHSFRTSCIRPGRFPRAPPGPKRSVGAGPIVSSPLPWHRPLRLRSFLPVMRRLPLINPRGSASIPVLSRRHSASTQDPARSGMSGGTRSSRGYRPRPTQWSGRTAVLSNRPGGCLRCRGNLAALDPETESEKHPSAPLLPGAGAGEHRRLASGQDVFLGRPRAKTISWGRIHGFRSCSMPVLPFLPALGGNWAFVFRRIQRLSPEKDRLAFPRPPVFQQRSRGKKRSGSPSSRTRIGLPEYGKKSAAWRHMKVPAGRDLRRFARFAPPAASNAGRADSTSRMRET